MNSRQDNERPSNWKKRSQKTLPRIRSALTNFLMCLTSFFFFIVSVMSANLTNYKDIILINLTLLPFILVSVELAFRMVHVTEEYNHILTRYENNVLKLIRDVFNFPTRFYVILVFSLIIIYSHYGQAAWKLLYEFGPTSVFTSFMGSLFLNRALNWNRGPLYDSLWIENSNGLDYGSGMAHSFFHGYLKLVLPKTGPEDKSILQLMQDYESSHRVQLECYKLFILIPKSLHCPESLMNMNISPSIEESSNLPEKKISRAGVKDRIYKNSVYKIKTDKGNKRIYVAAEYASPLLTFKEVVSYNGHHSEFYQRHKHDIVLQFYLTLKKVLREHESCVNFCELIFYDDKDENGSYYDVGKILLDKIKSCKKVKTH